MIRDICICGEGYCCDICCRGECEIYIPTRNEVEWQVKWFREYLTTMKLERTLFEMRGKLNELSKA